jgi:SAM-dependent methyltransferase
MMQAARTFLSRTYFFGLQAWLRPYLLHEWRRQGERKINERPVEWRFALDCLVRTDARVVLDVGSGSTAWPALLSYCGYNVTAVDKIEGTWTRGDQFNRHFKVFSDDITRSRLRGGYDLVTCLSVLEHIPDHAAAVRTMLALLAPGGHLVLSFPYNEKTYLPDVYRHPEAGYGRENPYIAQVYSRAEVDRWLTESQARIVDQEYWEMFTGEFWTMGTRIYPPRRVRATERHHLTCLLIQRSAA